MSIHVLTPSLAAKSLAIVLLTLTIVPACAQSGKAASAITQFVRAVQGNEFKSALTLLSSTRVDVRAIEDKNPRALHDKLVAQYYQEKVDQLSKNPGFWQNYSEALSAFMGSGSLQLVRGAQALFPTGSSFKVTELKTQPVMDMWSGRQFRKTTAYVQVEYPTLSVSPVFEEQRNERFLKGTIVQIELDNDLSIMALNRLPQGDSWWQRPYPTSEMTFLASRYRAQFQSARNEDQARVALDKLTNALPVESWHPLVLELLKQNPSYPLQLIAAVLGRSRSCGVEEYAEQWMQQKFSQGPPVDGCAADGRTMLTALRQCGKPTSQDRDTQLVIAALSSTLSYIVERVGTDKDTNRWNRTEQLACIQSYLQTLEEKTAKPYTRFQWLSSDGVHFKRILDDLVRYNISANWVDKATVGSSPAAAWLRRIKPCSPNLAWRCPSSLTVRSIEVVSEQSVFLRGEWGEYMDYYNSPKLTSKGTFTMELLAMPDDPKYPWRVQRIVDAPSFASVANAKAAAEASKPAGASNSAKAQSDPALDLLAGMSNELVVVASMRDAQFDINEVIAAKPNTFKCASGSTASPSFMAVQILSQMGKCVQVPYKGEQGALLDTTRGLTQWAILNLDTVAIPLREGRIRALAVLGRERNPQLPNVPAVGELLLSDATRAVLSVERQQPPGASTEESCRFTAPPPFTISSEYRGQCKNDLADGQGVVTGQLRDPKKGVLTFRIEGNFREGRKEGHSMYKRSDGFSSEGEYREGKANGTFVIIEESGNKYARTFRDGVPSGGQQPTQ